MTIFSIEDTYSLLCRSRRVAHCPVSTQFCHLRPITRPVKPVNSLWSETNTPLGVGREGRDPQIPAVGARDGFQRLPPRRGPRILGGGAGLHERAPNEKKVRVTPPKTKKIIAFRPLFFGKRHISRKKNIVLSPGWGCSCISSAPCSAVLGCH